MKCPVCKYEHNERYGKYADQSVIGALGDFFYKSGKKMKRVATTKFYSVEEATMYGCPSCGAAFIDTTGEGYAE